MKVALLYFSGTGGTAKFASDLAEGFRAEGCDVDLLRLKRESRFELSSYDLLGLGSPAYSFRIPRLVSRLLRKLNFHGKPFFVFCTSGGMAGNALWNLYRAGRRTAGVCLGDISATGMTNIRSWMPKRGEPLTALWPLNKHDCEAAQSFGSKILSRWKQWQEAPSRKLRLLWKPIPSLPTLLWSAFFTWRWMMAATAAFKHVDKERCNKCALCSTIICPSGAISITEDGWPRFNQRKCVGCNGCLNLCPQDAIWNFRSKNHRPYTLYKEYLLKK